MNLRKKLIAAALSATMLFSVTVSASVSATDEIIVKNNKTVATEKSKATTAVNESTVSRVEKSATQPSKAGKLINDIKDKATYEEALRTVLDDYYSNGNSENAEMLKKAVDSRGDKIFENYSNAENERKTEPKELGFIPGEVLAVTKAGINDENIPDIINDKRMSVTAVLPFNEGKKLVKIAISLEDTVDSAIEKLESNEYIEFIEKDQIYTTDYFLSDYIDDTKHEALYHLDMIKSVEAWKLIAKNDHQKTKVAVLDTGVDINHEDLKNIINRDLSVRISDDGIVTPLKGDNGSHGTHVSGIISAEANNNTGIAGVGSAIDNSAIDLIGIGCDTGDGASFSTITVYRAIKYAVENGARVINMSLGGQYDQNNIFSNAVELAVKSGCVVVCASGNADSSDYYYPSDCEGTISVIALDESGEYRASFSNYGASTNKVAAPGDPVHSTIPGNDYQSYAGTSMASPVVAGIAGMILSVRPELTVEDVKDIIFNSTDDLFKTGYDDSTGYGRVNAYKAVKKALEYDTENTTPTSIELSNSRLELAKGSKTKISATVFPATASQTVSYHSKNEGVATVLPDGTITAKASGTTEIIASTTNTILTKCTVVVKDKSISTLSTPTAEAVQTGTSTGATIKWDKVENADFYQIYACDTENGNYTYSGATTNTTFSTEMFSMYSRPVNTVSFYKVKAITNNNDISDSELSDTIAYVYVGQNPYLNADLIDEHGYKKGILTHWGAIVSGELYRTSAEDNKPVLLKTFYEGIDKNEYYDNNGDLKVGVTYTYTLKLFNTYKGVKYYGPEDSMTFEYQEDDPVVKTNSDPHINGVKFDNNVLYLSTYKDSNHIVGRIYCSVDNGETWATASNYFASGNEYSYSGVSYDMEIKPETKYLFKYKFYETGMLFGLYRNASKYSNIVSVVTPKNPITPQLSIDNSTGDSAKLSWTGESINNGFYTVYRRNQGSGAWETLITDYKGYNYVDTTVQRNNIYYYKVIYTNPTPEFQIESDCDLEIITTNLNSKDSNLVTFRTDDVVKDICTADFSEVKDIVYSQNISLPKITVTYNGTTLKEGVDYIVYSDNFREIGRASIIITGMGEYSGEKIIYYNITEPEIEATTYTVKYLDYDGTVLSTQEVAPNSFAVPPSDPKRAGYMFIGWSSNANNVTADTTITAKYKKSTSKLYTVTFVDRENNVLSSQKLAFGETAKLPQAPILTGYQFVEWEGNYSAVSNNTLVKAKYKATSFESGIGTKVNPYIIASPEQLDYFSYVINYRNAEYGNCYYKLANDIFYNDITDCGSWGYDGITGEIHYPENIWEPAGIKLENSTSSNSFKGNFDGNGYSIYGLFIKETRDNVGFIGSAENAVITNLGIENSYINTQGNNAGALVGLFSSTSSDTEIYCCYTRDNYVVANGNAGGFAGEIIGITGSSNINISNSYSSDSLVIINDDFYYGGFAGLISSSGKINMRYCYTNNDYYSEASYPKSGIFCGDILQSNTGSIVIKDTYCLRWSWDTYYSEDPDFGTPIDTVSITSYEFDTFNKEMNLSTLNGFISKEYLKYSKNSVWVFSEEDIPRLYTEKDKYTLEMYLDDELFYITCLREGDKVNAPYLNLDYGYTATGWSAEIPETMPDSNITLFNQVKENTYTVDFYVNDNYIVSKTYYEGEKIEAPLPPPGGKNIIWRDLPLTMPNENIVVYGYIPTLGDVNCDGSINISDVIFAMKAVINPDMLNRTQMQNADVNRDGILNVSDVIMLQKFIIGKISTLQ